MTSQQSFNSHTGDELAHSPMPMQQPAFGPALYNVPPYQTIQQQHHQHQQQRQVRDSAGYLGPDEQGEMAVDAMDAFQEGPGPFTCNVCGRQYHRHCDLNRHAKSHQRPYKCPEAECKYQTLGWPTEQELQRHHNDVHASTPRTFACNFEPCGQKFKRESNCKQHMEKAHQWPYVRSRTVRASYRCRVVGCNECSSPEETQRKHALSPLTPVTVQGAQQFGGDPILFPDEMVSHLLNSQADQVYTFAPPEGQDPSKPYVPWQSPPSRQHDITNVLHKVQTTSAGSAFPLDPALLQPGSQPTHHQLSQYNSPITEQSSAPQACPGLMHSPSPQISSYPESRWPTTPNYQPSQEAFQNAAAGQATTTQAQSSRQPSTQPLQHSPIGKRKQPASERDDDEDDDNAKRPRRGKHRSMPAENFTDETMPCPFHLSDPEVFCRSNKEKYSPCHTDHKDISTIVRHLARPAHKLVVKAKYISSFDAEDMEKAYIPAGLCRNCWKSFTDRTEFNRHFTQSCPRVSRGKREKFRLLYTTFCSEMANEDDDHEDDDAEGDSPSVAGDGDDDDADGEGEDEEEDVRQTVQLLTARCEKMEANFNRLAQMTMKLYNACGQSGIIVNAGPLPKSPSQPSAGEQDLKPRAASTSDTGGLVGGMDSAPLDVDRDSLMSEEAHQALPILQVTPSTGREIEAEGNIVLSPTTLRHPNQVRLPRRMAGVQSDSGYTGGLAKGKGVAVAVAIPANTSVSTTPASAPASSNSMARSFTSLDMEQQATGGPFGRSMSLQVGGTLPEQAEQGVPDSQGSFSNVDFGAYVEFDFSSQERQYGA